MFSGFVSIFGSNRDKGPYNSTYGGWKRSRGQGGWLDTRRVGGDPCDGFQGVYSTLEVDAASPQSPQPGAAGRIQEAIGLVTAGGTIKIVGGTYDGTNIEDVDATTKSVNLSP